MVNLQTGSAHPKPSAMALEMEKQWSHKLTTHPAKTWPPVAPAPPAAVECGALPWSKSGAVPEIFPDVSVVHLESQFQSHHESVQHVQVSETA